MGVTGLVLGSESSPHSWGALRTEPVGRTGWNDRMTGLGLPARQNQIPF